MESENKEELKTDETPVDTQAGSGKAPEGDDFSDINGDSLAPIVAKDIILPMSSYGIGPVFCGIAVFLTAFGIFFRQRWIFSSGVPSSKILRYTYLGLGILLIIAGGLMWLDAVFTARVDDYIKANKLCTKGIYGWTRNPIYAGILFICTGALFISGNVYMYVIPILLWVLLTILLKKTEEPELISRFKLDYTDYMVSVNRILPKPPKKNRPTEKNKPSKKKKA